MGDGVGEDGNLIGRRTLELDTSEDEVGRAVEEQADEPGVGRVDQPLRGIQCAEGLGDAGSAREVLVEVDVEDVVDEARHRVDAVIPDICHAYVDESRYKYISPRVKRDNRYNHA